MIQSGLELRNALLVVLRYSLCSRSWGYFFFYQLPLTLELFVCNNDNVFISLLLVCPCCLPEKSHLSQTVQSSCAHEGDNNGFAVCAEVWIIFKWNDIRVFFPPSVVWICPQLFPDSGRRCPALGIEPQTRSFSLLFIGCGGNRVEPLSGTTPLLWHLHERTYFSVTFTRTIPPLTARLFSLFKPTFASLFWDQNV